MPTIYFIYFSFYQVMFLWDHVSILRSGVFSRRYSFKNCKDFFFSYVSWKNNGNKWDFRLMEPTVGGTSGFVTTVEFPWAEGGLLPWRHLIYLQCKPDGTPAGSVGAGFWGARPWNLLAVAKPETNLCPRRMQGSWHVCRIYIAPSLHHSSSDQRELGVCSCAHSKTVYHLLY